MKAVQLDFKYTQSEYVKADRQFLMLKKAVRKYDPILFLVVCLFSISYIFISSFSILSMIVMGLVLIFIVLESYLYFLMPILKFKHTKKYQDEYNMIFSSDTIIWRTPSIETEMKWDFYSELWESNDFYFLVQSPHIYGIIPKRAFAANTDKYTFEEIALSNLKSVKR